MNLIEDIRDEIITKPTVLQLFTTPEKGAALKAHTEVKAVARSGILGDRWYRSRWTHPEWVRRLNAWRKKMVFTNTNVSILSMSDLERGNEELRKLKPDVQPYSTSEMRRNIVLAGEIDLNSLKGREFWIGGVKMRWSQMCTPCGLPTKRAGRDLKQIPAFKKAFGDEELCWSGIRATILNSGQISIGDRLRLA